MITLVVLERKNVIKLIHFRNKLSVPSLGVMGGARAIALMADHGPRSLGEPHALYYYRRVVGFSHSGNGIDCMRQRRSRCLGSHKTDTYSKRQRSRRSDRGAGKSNPLSSMYGSPRLGKRASALP